MISSPEEARLLLNKWRSEAVRLVAFITTFPSPPADLVIRLDGFVTAITERGESGAVIFESGENFIMFRLSEVIEYKESVEMSADLPQLMAREKQRWRAALCLSYSHTTLVFCENV